MMTKIDFVTALDWTLKNLNGRLGALNLLVPCNRCGGSGNYSFCPGHGTTCFGCNGGGKGLPKLTVKLLKIAQEKVAAGDLEPYFATCKAKAKARAMIKPLIQKAKTLYAPIGQAYDVEYTRDRGGEGPMDPKVFAAQTMNNAIYYGSTKRAANPSQMSVSEIESAIKFNEISSDVAVTLLQERIEQLTQLQKAFTDKS
jgi:hypothetical protein